MEAPQEELAPITAQDDEALKRYNETYGTIVANKTCKIEEYPYTLRKLMDEHGRTYENFSEVSKLCLGCVITPLPASPLKRVRFSQKIIKGKEGRVTVRF